MRCRGIRKRFLLPWKEYERAVAFGSTTRPYPPQQSRQIQWVKNVYGKSLFSSNKKRGRGHLTSQSYKKRPNEANSNDRVQNRETQKLRAAPLSSRPDDDVSRNALTDSRRTVGHPPKKIPLRKRFANKYIIHMVIKSKHRNESKLTLFKKTILFIT